MADEIDNQPASPGNICHNSQARPAEHQHQSKGEERIPGEHQGVDLGRLQVEALGLSSGVDLSAPALKSSSSFISSPPN